MSMPHTIHESAASRSPKPHTKIPSGRQNAIMHKSAEIIAAAERVIKFCIVCMRADMSENSSARPSERPIARQSSATALQMYVKNFGNGGNEV